MRYSSRLAFAFALLSSTAFAQQVNDVQLRPGSSALWGASFNANNNQVIDQFNTAGSVVDSFRFFQGTSAAQGTQIFSMSPTGMVAGAATGSRQGPGTINATGFYVNGVALTAGGSPGGSSGQIQYNNAGAFGGFTTSGDATINTASGALTLATVNGNVGTWGSATLCSAFTVNAKGLITGAAQSACTPALANITGFGTGVAAALALNVGSAGAPVVFNGAGGTPSSLTLTNATGLPIAGTTGYGAGVATWLATPSSANLASAVTGETGSGALVFATSPALVTPALGTPASGVITNLTGTCAACTANTFTAGSATNLTSGTLNSARLAWNSAVFTGTPANPTGTTSASAVMMGVGSTCTITPTFSTRVHFNIVGVGFNSAANQTTAVSLRYGTGAAPANGVAGTGTLLGAQQGLVVTGGGGGNGFSLAGIATGLTTGVAVWFDITALVSTGTATVTGLTCIAYEL